MVKNTSNIPNYEQNALKYSVILKKNNQYFKGTRNVIYN